MDTRIDLRLAARRRSDRSAAAASAVAAALAVAAVILAGILVLVLEGHGISWLAGLVAGAAAAAWLTVGRGQSGSRPATTGAGAQRRTELAVEPLGAAGWSFLHAVPGPDGPYDHIAVGPGGLILLQSLAPDGVVRMVGGEPVVETLADGETRPRVQRLRPTALADAVSLRERVQRIAERRMWVQAVVVLWSDFPAGCVADGRCVYIHGSRLAAWMSRRPHQFEEGETEAVAAAVRELAARGAGLDRPVAV